MRLFAVLALLAAGPLMAPVMTPAMAEDFAPREGEAVLSDVQMQSVVVGATHEFFDGGRSFFSISGSYSYTYPDGGVAYGSYELRDGGIVCTSFNHGFSRCDMYVLRGERLVLIDEDGTRFPVRQRS